MDKLITCFYRRPSAVTRLICFPWAGGGSLYYAQWGKLFDDTIEVYSIKLPGRESRSKEPFAQNMEQIVDEVIQALLPELQEKSFAFFGHSFGSFTSFATAVRLKETYGLEPVHLFVSGASAPHSKTRFPNQKRSELSDEDFLKWMSHTGGTPAEVLQNKDAMQLFIPPLKADLRVVENFVYEKPDTHVLSCGITCFDGTEDVPHDLEAWSHLTKGDFSIHKLPGGHFYLKDPTNEKHLVNHICKYLETAEMSYL
ncbi:S-acyl fatty acid synthase thioesterase, medium chain isoform X2 [Bombina bombina]|uniref:S-acyl fatty acid synthase thioesterase, medium chain isoform X2 n=1 Tax=Bombina bombina TaxID=8345 RepID=UPI00235AF39A|nr:S-acyl fatty acid synthase thioesterase, medium chain isoform X2 [Bombina bombina]